MLSFIFCCYERNSKKAIESLIEKGTNINARNCYGWTSLHYAALVGNVEVAKLLFINKKANVNERDSYGRTPLYYAVMSNNKKAIEFLIEKEANVNEIIVGRPLLHYAIYTGDIKVVELLINAKVDVNKINDDGDIPLHFAISRGNVKVVKLLINAGADVNKINKKGETPLHYAVLKGKIECARAIIPHVYETEKPDYIANHNQFSAIWDEVRLANSKAGSPPTSPTWGSMPDSDIDEIKRVESAKTPEQGI